MQAIYTDIIQPTATEGVDKNLQRIARRTPIVVINRPSILEKMQTIAEEVTFINRQGEYENHIKRVIEESHKFGKGKLLAAKERYLSYLPDINTLQVNHVYQQLLSVKNPNPDQVSNLVKFVFKDPTQQFAVFNYLEARISEEQPELKSAIEEARMKLLKTSSKEVYAGLNVSFEAQKLAAISDTTVTDVRSFYRDVVLNYHSLAKAYNIIVEKYGTKDFFQVVEFLLNGLSNDINAENSSTDPVFLEVVLKDIRKLQELMSIYEISEQLLTFLRRSYGVGSRKTASQVTSMVLQAATETGLTMDDIQRLFDSVGIGTNRSASLGCLNYLDIMLHQFPEDIFINNKIQNNSLKAIMNYSNLLTKMDDSNKLRRI